MKTNARRIVSWVAALTLLLTCTISGLVLPAAAEDPVAVENLVPNGDFEEGAVAPWTGVSETVTVEDGVGFGGSKGLQFAAGGEAAEIYWKSFAPTLEANSVYELTFLAKGPKIRLAINSKTDVTMGTVYAELLPSQWTMYRAVIRTGTNPSIDAHYGLYFRRDDPAEEPTYIDNVVMKKWDGNVICGGEFDVVPYHFARPHFANGAATIETEADGNNAMLIPASTSALGDKFLMGLSATIEASTDYVLSMDVKGAPINVFVYGGGGATGGVTGKWNVTEQSDEYRHYTYEFTTIASLNNTNHLINITRNTPATLNTATGTYIDNVKLVKKVYATDITLNQSTADLLVGDTLTLTATAAPAGSVFAEEVVWSTTDAAVATVENGVVTAVGAGTATITATAGTLSATCVVTVTAPEPSDSDNLVPNGDFEQGAVAPWTGVNALVTVENGVGFGGGKGLQFAAGGAAEIYWKSFAPALEPNSVYELTFLAKGPELRLAVNSKTDVTFNPVYAKPVAGEWVTVRGTLKTGANPSIDSNWGMYFRRDSSATEPTYIDNVSLVKFDADADRVLGGNFDAIGQAHWTNHLNAGATVVTEADGNKALMLPSSLTGDTWFMDASLTPGTLYTLTLKVKGAPINVFLYGSNGNYATGDDVDVWHETAQSDTYQTYTYTFVAGEGLEATDDYLLNITRKTAATQTGAVTYIDDISLCKQSVLPATAITLNKTELSLGVGVNGTLTVTTTPIGSAYDSLTWESNNTAVATVDQNGVVTGVATGTATITATAMVGTTPLTATCTVAVVVKAESFEIVQDALHLAPATDSNRLWVCETIDLITVPADADISGLTWSSSDETVATVDANGKVKALAAGTATITVTDGTLSDQITVTVDDDGERITGGDFEGDDWNVQYWTESIIKNGAASLVEDPTNAGNTVLMIPGNKQALWLWPAHVDKSVYYKLTMRVMSAGGKAIMHFTSGHVEGNSDSGWVTRTISTEGWTEVSYIVRPSGTNFNRNYLIGFGTDNEANALYIDNVSLVKLPQASSIALEDTQIGVKGSKTLEIITTPAEANVEGLVWESSDPSIISVDQTGKITAVAGEGSVTITVKNADESMSASCTVTIAGDYATAIKLNVGTHYAKKNSTLQLVMSTTPADGMYKKPVWTSSDETIATVDANGLVTVADKEGETTITVTSGTLTATCQIIVPGAAQSFELKDETLKLALPRGTKTISKTLSVVTTPKNSDPGTLTWTSSDDAIVSVDANGKVTALAEGEATITVKNADGSITDTCVVTVARDGERLIGGDFENNDWDVITWTNNIIKDGKGYVTADPDDMDNMVLAFPRDNTALDALWLSDLHVNAGKTYKISFKVKGDGENAAQLVMFFHSNSCNLNGWKYTNNIGGDWKEVSYIFTTNALDDGTSAALNRFYILGIDNNTDAIVYLDDFSLVELPDATAITVGSSNEMTIRPEGTATLKVNTVPAEADAGILTWASSNPNVIAVDASGKITVLADEGSAVITVTNDKGLSDTITVTIDSYAELLENGDFEMGDTFWAAHATIEAGAGVDGSYGMVLDNASAKVDYFYKGTLPLQPATKYILEWDYKKQPDAEFRLWAGKIGLTAYTSNEAAEGEWAHGSVIFTTPADMVDINNAKYIGWTFAVVSDKPGSSAKAVVDNISLKLYTSGVEAESIKLNKETMTMMPGRTENIAIMATPTDGDINRAKWTSSNENVATVEYGIVTAVGKGTATITATTYDGRLSASCTVTVAGEPAFITNGTFDNATNNAWTMDGSASIGSGVGVQGTNAGVLPAGTDNALKQAVTNLKPETTYQLFIRYRATSDSKLSIKLLNGSNATELVAKSADVTTSWTKSTYEFTTPADLDENSVLVLAPESGTGTIYVDHVFLAQKASLIDLVVNEIVWDGGNEQVKPGTELTFYVMIENKGEDPVPAGSTIDTDICVDGTPVQTISYLVPADMAGGSTALIPGTAPWAAVEGDHVISARVNSTMSVLEFDPTNNNLFQKDLRVNDVILEIPEIAANAGFDTLGFSDDFNNINLIDSGDTRTDGYKWYVSRPYGTASVTTDGYYIENGILKLVDPNPVYNMSLTTAEYNSGIGFTYNQGYMEVRIRIPRPRENQEGETGIPAIWALPIEKLQGSDTVPWVEMDWLEYWGDQGGRKPEGYYTITLHDQGPAGDPNSHWYRNPNHGQVGLGDGEWHTMGWLWVKNAVIGYLDGVETFRFTYDPEDFSDPMASVVKPGSAEDVGIGAFSLMNEQWLPVHISGSKDNPMEMDYIRIWTGTGGGSIVIPDDDSDVVIDIEAEDFWYNFCTDDWGDPITEVTEENYHNILGLNPETGEYEAVYIWEHLTQERRDEINAFLASLGMPSYDELLAQALLFVDGGGEDTPDTGEHTALPVALATTAMVMSAAALWISRKRKQNKA